MTLTRPTHREFLVFRTKVSGKSQGDTPANPDPGDTQLTRGVNASHEAAEPIRHSPPLVRQRRVVPRRSNAVAARSRACSRRRGSPMRTGVPTAAVHHPPPTGTMPRPTIVRRVPSVATMTPTRRLSAPGPAPRSARAPSSTSCRRIDAAPAFGRGEYFRRKRCCAGWFGPSIIIPEVGGPTTKAQVHVAHSSAPRPNARRLNLVRRRWSHRRSECPVRQRRRSPGCRNPTY